MDFCVLPSGAKTLTNVTVPSDIIGQDGGLTQTDIHIGADGKITDTPQEQQIDMKGAMALPTFVDMHTHLDKGHIWPRSPNPDGTFMGALQTVGEDRKDNWTAEDVKTRMDFALRTAYAHGTKAIRTHIDSLPPQAPISFPVFAELKEKWAGKIELQGSCLVAADRIDRSGEFGDIAETTISNGGILGAVTYPVPNLKQHLLDFFHYAMRYDTDVDFHVDETDDPTSDTLAMIAETVLELGFSNRVTVGHCCSISVMEPERAEEIIGRVAEAKLNVVSLPMCNMYLQDRYAGRTPRWRGVTMVHELKAAGVNVAFASDNTRDPFYAYGDLDMIEVMREATRICQLDHREDDWLSAFIANPATACGFDTPTLAVGQPADLVICKARRWSELFARPQMDRIVIRDGNAIDRTLPDYSELDHLMS